jgi:monomeric sarcosine oxidase
MDRIVVIGAGGVGSAAARFLAGEGHRVTVLERFGVDHDRGSSYGSSRIIRRVYPDRLYTRLMGEAYPLWEALERDAGTELLTRTGGFFFGREGDPNLAQIRDALTANSVPFDLMGPADAADRFPAFRLGPDEIGIHQEDGGILNASACVRANLRLAERHGAEIRPHTGVRRFDLSPECVTLKLSDGSELQADRLVLAAGPWMNDLLEPYLQLPLTVTRQVYCNFEPHPPSDTFEIGRFPVWIDFGTNFYGFPHEPNAPGVKVACHDPGRPADPGEVDREVHGEDRELLRRYISHRLPGLSPRSVLEKVCLYTNTPDEDFIIDRLPQDPRVVIMSPCSGHGFKFIVLMGRIAADMATGKILPWDLQRFRLDRFNPPAAGGG